ncbi:hypothetical protein AB0892_23325 [Streptomyces sp. NPDC005409]|uniref:hypothetical protein n=1 Tax=Streptomyces sp. NPDC005409 TaxID=3155342 RepID=UPI0034572149
MSFWIAAANSFVPATEMAAAAVDGRGRVTAWSPGAQLLLGYAAQHVAGARRG